MKTILITLLITFTALASEQARKALRLPLKGSDFSPATSRLTQEQEVIVMTILGEARGEKEIGMYAVACVIKERMDKRKACGIAICTAWRQFSCWNPKDSDRRLRKLLNRSKEHLYAIKLAQAVTTKNGLDKRVTKNADHYCTLKTNPYWSYKTVVKGGKKIKVPIKPVKVIGNHKFFKLN